MSMVREYAMGGQRLVPRRAPAAPPRPPRLHPDPCCPAPPLLPVRSADFIEWTDIAREAATGKAYLHTHTDVNGRPVIIVRAAKHFTGGPPLQPSAAEQCRLTDNTEQQTSWRRSIAAVALA